MKNERLSRSRRLDSELRVEDGLRDIRQWRSVYTRNSSTCANLGKKVKRWWFNTRGRQLLKELNPGENFKFSDHWFARFQRRHTIALYESCADSYCTATSMGAAGVNHKIPQGTFEGATVRCLHCKRYCKHGPNFSSFYPGRWENL